uniref:non-specific serine/threonine protein kinase n=1 Tax=Wollemia nobilis TaxID=56998 RepID=A0A0C9QNB8_9CONI
MRNEPQWNHHKLDPMISLGAALPMALLWIWVLLFLPCSASAAKGNTTFAFQRFNQTGELVVLGESALIPSKSAVLLTNHTHFILGRVFYPAPVRMKPHGNNRTISSFSTTFVFSMVRPASDAGGHGITFLMAPSRSLSGALSAEYIGLLNFTSDGQDYNHLFAVEFDTSKNVEFLDPDDNHVGIDVNNLQSVKTEYAGYWDGKNGFQTLSLKSGRNIQAWIDYSHPNTQLNVTIALAGMPKPQRPLINLSIDLSTILEEETYVGFSAATGNFVEDHYLLAWSFSNNGTAPPLDVTGLPSFTPNYSTRPSKTFVVGVTLASALLLSVTVAGIIMWLRRIKQQQREEEIEEWELEYWPHRFPYKELSIATNGFSEDEVLGHGGFGRVYHGVIPGTGLEVAVKCITREFTEGMKGFIAEVTSMGRLQHRNLVQLRGWCRRNRQLFIVYDYMPNGSLDRMIFCRPALTWGQRYHILKGVAAGLLYLHEEWEKRVVHRDIKSSNVLLDTELNARLGDFGLARLYEHSENPQTTHVVGTLGYIAPELIHTGKATPSSDVFSFGALLLEVACGRKPVEPAKDPEEVVLVEWVWDLYTKEKLLDAADPKLAGQYDVEEMDRVLKLGLFCSHPEAESRPGIRSAWQILEGQIPLPELDVDSFSGSGLTPRGFFRCNHGGPSSYSSAKMHIDMFSRSESRTRRTSASDSSYCRDSSCQSLSSGR